MGCNENSDFGYGSASSSSSSLWVTKDKWPSFPSQEQLMDTRQKSASYMDVWMRRGSVDDVMREFHMNGSDAPYNPDTDDDNIWAITPGETILGMSQCAGGGRAGAGAGAGYARQHSWPSTSARRVTPTPAWPSRGEFATSTPIFDESEGVRAGAPPPPPPATLTEVQVSALRSLPDDVLYSLLKGLRARHAPPPPPQPLDRRTKNQECRFCKNNGERESYYRSHSLKTGGRVSCPVLRAFVCRRCGATGDDAHTLKYCPLATSAERLKSMAMMRSVRMASGRRRYTLPPAASAVDGDDYVLFGDTTPSVVADNDFYYRFAATPLNPQWAALEKKLML